MYCPHCGAATKDADLFCPECGGRLGDLPAQEAPIAMEALPEPQPAQEPAPLSELAVSVAAEPTPPAPAALLLPDLSTLTTSTAVSSEACAVDPNKKKGSAVKWIAIALALLVLGCCSCVLFFLVVGLLMQSGPSVTPLGDLLRSLLPLW